MSMETVSRLSTPSRGDWAKAALTNAPTSAVSAPILDERENGQKLAFGAPLFQDARFGILSHSGSPLHLAQDNGGSVGPRSDGQRPRRLFRDDRTPEGGVSRGAAGPYFLGHGSGLVLRRTGRPRRRPALAQRLRGQRLDDRENAERGLRRDDVHPSPARRSGGRDVGRAQSRDDPPGRGAWRA